MVGVASPPASSDFRTEPETVHLSTPYPQFMSLFQDLANKARNYAHNDSRNNDRKGVLLPLPTKSEVEAQCQFVEIYITSIPTSGASITVKNIDEIIRRNRVAEAPRLQHLRRLVKLEQLPESLQHSINASPLSETARCSDGKRDEFRLEDEATSSWRITSTPDARNTNPTRVSMLQLLICPVTTLPPNFMGESWSRTFTSTVDDVPLSPLRISVPVQPPVSESQAKEWSQKFWPTIYKKQNPFGPQPALVARTASEIHKHAATLIDIAKMVGRESVDSLVGKDVGVVIVDRSKPGDPSVVMVAGDARWRFGRGGKLPGDSNGNGNVLAHPVMRAIALIARKRTLVAQEPHQQRDHDHVSDVFVDQPVTPLEHHAFNKSEIQPEGYLCLDLEFYLTHEPCIMCSMALIHSRAGNVVFEKRMPQTGGLTPGRGLPEKGPEVVLGDEGESSRESQNGLGYGIFWRSSLNWKFLTWQWVWEGSVSPNVDEQWHA